MFHAFTVGFEEVLKSFTSRGFVWFNWHSFAQFLAWRSLLWLSMTWRKRYLTQNYFLSIMIFDIKDFYPSITKKLIDNVFSFAQQHVQIKREEVTIIQHASKSPQRENSVVKEKLQLFWWSNRILWRSWSLWTCKFVCFK